jgi:bleomycin hydrolase
MKTFSKNITAIVVFGLMGCNSPKAVPKREVSKYQFTTIKEIAHTPIEYQNLSGTCWAFAMTSLFESEIVRKTGKTIDLSEMYIVRNAYLQKSYAHIMRHGQTPLGEGAMNPDALSAIEEYGIMPQSVYTGLKKGDKLPDHTQLFKELQEILPKYAKKGIRQGNWQTEITATLDKNMGAAPAQFNYESQEFNPQSFKEKLGVKPADYVHITSFSHKPFYENMVLDVEWNYLNKPFYNVPIDAFLDNFDHAIDKGFTVAVELDVSEKTYSGDYGIAVVPQNTTDSVSILYNPSPEKEITQAYRQQEFENFHTINDHNQHIVGKVKDQTGKIYYIAKNSWQGWGRDGFIYISQAYIKLKVLYYTVHKDGLKIKISSNE